MHIFRFNGDSLGATLARGVRISSAEDATWETFAALSHRTKDVAVAVDASSGQPQQLAKEKMREREREKSVMQACKQATASGSRTPEATLSLFSLSVSLPPEVVAFGRGEH